MVMSVESDSSRVLTPDMLIGSYTQAYRIVYGNDPKARYMGNQWFRINGEVVHYRLLREEVAQLQALAKRKRLNANSKSVMRRLIDKLRMM